LSQLIARARVLPVDIDTIENVAKLRNECRQIGHGLHQRNHNADLWIAATAIRWSASPSSHTTRSSSAAPASSSGRRSIRDHALETAPAIFSRGLLSQPTVAPHVAGGDGFLDPAEQKVSARVRLSLPISLLVSPRVDG
jgi:hypothetical protein